MQRLNQALIVSAAFLVAGCAAFFSVTGLGNLFKSFSVMFMAGSLEYAKLVTASYLKNRWDELGRLLRLYLSFAVLVLMFITSMGIYGFLSDAFQKQSIRIEQVERQVVLLENRISINKSEIDRYTKQSANLMNIRNSQEQNFSQLISDKRATGRISTMIRNADKEIAQNSRKIDSLNNANVILYNNIDSVKNQNVDLEREVGGFRFVADSFGVSIKTAVKWFILMIVFVFDPLAIALVLAYNTKRKNMIVEEKKEIVKQFDKNWVLSMVEVTKKQRGRPRKYGQNSEEVYIRHILATIGDGKFLVELGAKDGFNQTNARYFMEKGYQALLIDADAPDGSQIKKHKVIPANVIPLLKTYKCPKVFDLLCVDLDGLDYWVLKTILQSYSPRLVVAEFNPCLERTMSVTVPNDSNFQWQGDSFYGFSFEAGKRLGQEFGYTVVHQENNNIFLVANEYLEGVEVPEVSYEQSELFKKSENENWVEV